MLVAGASAGMAAVFATPLAAVLLAVELLLFEWKPRSFIPVAVAAIIASVLRQPLLGAGPVFPIAAHGAPDLPLLGLALGIGVVAGLVSGALTTLVYACEDAFARLPVHWMWWPALGGLVVGVGGLVDPRVLGVGYETIHGLLRGDVLGLTLLTLLLTKAFVWSVALGSGTSGGVLAPLLMIGGAVGAALAAVTGWGDPGLGAVIGMAAMMGGTMRAPLTGTVFMFELTRDQNVLPALLVGSVAAVAVTVLLLRRSILTEKLARRGQHISYDYGVDLFDLVRVGEVMDQRPPVVPPDLVVSELADRIAHSDPVLARRQATLLVDADGTLRGIVTRGDLMRALEENPQAPLGALMAERNLQVAYPDETLQDAVARMLRHDIGRLPVISREVEHPRLLGYLGRAEILAARQRWHDEEERRERALLVPPRSPDAGTA